MKNKNMGTNSGISFLGMLSILFIGLKLSKIISWSWWLVLLPLYGPVLLLIIIIAISIYFTK